MDPATVTQVMPRLMVKMEGSATELPALRLSSYIPAVADRVAVVEFGARLLCLGKVT